MVLSTVKSVPRLLIAGTVLALAGCSFVSLSPEAEDVRILEPERTADCDRKGKTTVETAARILFIPRGQKAIEEDLDRLARNSAIDLNGDTAYRDTEIEDGEATYEVYDCVE